MARQGVARQGAAANPLIMVGSTGRKRERRNEREEKINDRKIKERDVKKLNSQ